MLGILTITHNISIWQVLATAFLMGTINSFDIPSRQSFLIEMVGRGHLLNAIALHSASFHAARIIGPLIAGLLISWLGLPYCFLINALSFIPVVMVLRKMRIEESNFRRQKGILREFREGFQFIRKDREIFRLLLTIMVFSLMGMPYNHFLPYFAEDVFGHGARGLGFLMAAGGLGALLAALTLAVRGDIRDKRRYITKASFAFPSALILFSLIRMFVPAMGLLMITGFSLVSLLATSNSFIQLRVPDNLRGRVMSVFSFLFLGMVPIGSFVLGYLAEYFGTSRMVLLSGIVCLGAAVVLRWSWRGSE